ncbi:hypothetical protein Fmac_031390 [Flemingia macrophylla]|uniref:Uncharacterized protein n=1 Tax=Flemingia macrophylla TaxID=520843 RepID=A0ABD1L1X4_9FABA
MLLKKLVQGSVKEHYFLEVSVTFSPTKYEERTVIPRQSSKSVIEVLNGRKYL